MEPIKPVFMKTYGKQRRKLSAWVTADNRKQAFDTTSSSDGDISVFEPLKPTRLRGRKSSVACRRAMRPAKKKAMLCLTERSVYEDNILSPSCPQPAQQSTTTREKKTFGSSGGAVLPAKSKATLCLSQTSSDEENIKRPSPPPPQLVQQSKTTRKSRLVSVPGILMKQKGQQVPGYSESEEDSMSPAKCLKNSVQMKKDSKVRPPSAGRFVTRRRRAGTTKLKLPKKTVCILNSSDDFTPGTFGSSKILRPLKRRRVPKAFVVSSAENSVNAGQPASFATTNFQEVNLSELTDHSLRLCPRKPIFCSTPSAGPVSHRPRLKPLSINDQSSTPTSMSVSRISVLSTFQEGQDSRGQPHSPPNSVPPIELHSEEKLHLRLVEQEHSGDLFLESKSVNKRSCCSEEAKGQSEMIKTKNVEELQSVTLLSTDDSGSSSRFVSAAGGLEWLIQALKEKCLTECCTVQLERLSNLTMTQLCSQTTYSSCLGLLSSVNSQPDEQPPSVDSVQNIDLSLSSEPLSDLHLSVKNNKTSLSKSVIGFDSPEHAALVTDSQCLYVSPSVNCDHSVKHSSTEQPMELSVSGLHGEPTHTIDSSSDFIMGTQLPVNSPTQALFTEQRTRARRDECRTKKCVVPLKKLGFSKVAVQELKRFTQQKEAGPACDETSANPDAKYSENDHTRDEDNNPDDLRHSGEITERMMAAVRQPIDGLVAQTKCDGPETEEKAAALTAMLKEKCLTDKLIVKIKRETLSQLKEILQLREHKNKSPTDSDSTSDDQTKNPQQSDRDTFHCNQDSSALNVNVRKRGSTSSQYKIASDVEVARNSSNVPHKRKKTSLAPKEKKRRSTDHSRTTRRACVSGLSVSRWKNKDSASTHVFRSRMAQTGGNKTVDCSINELISTQHQPPKELFGTTTSFSTPVRANRLNLSSLLADLTPNTHTWSRLKAALSVHRKAMVLLTPSDRQSVSGTPRRVEVGDTSQDLFTTPFRTPLPKCLRSQLMSCDSVAEIEDAEKVYAECGQQRPLPWDECILPQQMQQCVKIGEGTFGEVFSTTNVSGDPVAIKIIPVEGSEKVNGEDQKTFGEILHEIIISKELSSLKEKQQNQTHGFIGLKDLHCVQGCYPPDFLNAWDAFDQEKGSENDRPDFFEKDQLFIILEFEFGGTDLENCNGTLTSLGVAKSILHQVTAALAVAEQELHFEHRDLHWGNVLVKTTKQKKGSFLLNGAAHSLETKGVLVRIIDYSLSRLEIDDLTVSCDISKDEELFMGQGDYQFEIYRLMRQENGNNWSDYHPHTNVLWLHYLCSKLLSMKYRGSGGRGAKNMREELTRFYDNVLQYSSATEALQNCPMFQ